MRARIEAPAPFSYLEDSMKLIRMLALAACEPTAAPTTTPAATPTSVPTTAPAAVASKVSANTASGGAGGNEPANAAKGIGGAASGGGIATTMSVRLIGSTFSDNQALGGAGSLRVTYGTPAENARFLEVLSQLL